MAEETDFVDSLVIPAETRELAQMYAFAKPDGRLAGAYLLLGFVAAYVALLVPLTHAQGVCLGFLGGVLVGAGTERVIAGPVRRALKQYLPTRH